MAVIDLVPANSGCLLAPEEFSWGLAPGETELSGSEPLQCTVPNRSDVPESKCKVPELEQEARTVGAGSQIWGRVTVGGEAGLQEMAILLDSIAANRISSQAQLINSKILT